MCTCMYIYVCAYSIRFSASPVLSYFVVLLHGWSFMYGTLSGLPKYLMNFPQSSHTRAGLLDPTLHDQFTSLVFSCEQRVCSFAILTSASTMSLRSFSTCSFIVAITFSFFRIFYLLQSGVFSYLHSFYSQSLSLPLLKLVHNFHIHSTCVL